MHEQALPLQSIEVERLELARGQLGQSSEVNWRLPIIASNARPRTAGVRLLQSSSNAAPASGVFMDATSTTAPC